MMEKFRIKRGSMRYDEALTRLSHMSYSHLAFEPAPDGIVLLTVRRPEKLNALNRETMNELDDAFRRTESDPSVRGLIITGAGEKAFVAGADISELAALDPVAARELTLRGQSIFRRLETMGKPSVAAINGYAMGGGLELALCCTLRVAVPHARLGQPEVKLGIIPGYGGTQRLPRLVGRGRALELLLTGESIEAAEAQRIGLVNHVVAPEELIEFSRALLRKILANAPVAVALVMDAVDAGLDASLEEGLRYEAAAFAVAAATEDRREGTRAFLEKRTPVFRGN
jgi:enoyl-CoA hydratase